MISSSDRISRKEEINELFEQLGQVLEERVEALLIGGAVMLELGLKDSTKDIDVVCRSEEDKEKLLAAAKALGFEIVGPEKRHERLGVKRLAVKGTGGVARPMTEQNRKYVTKEIGKLLSEIWRIKGLAEQEYGPQHPITRKLGSMHGDVQALLREKTGKPQ